jgi:hypothetical protein
VWSDFVSALRSLDFKQMNEILSGIDVLTILKNPWVIAFMVIACIVFLIRGMERALVGFLSIPAALVLFQKTVQGKNALDFDAQKLMIFVIGFVVIAAVNVYFWVIRSGK